MKQKGEPIKRDTEPAAPAADPSPHWKTLTIDWKAYEHYLEGSGLTDGQKHEFLQALWNIIVGFVDLGFEINPVQQACGQKEENGPSGDSARKSVIKSRSTSNQKQQDKEDEQARLSLAGGKNDL